MSAIYRKMALFAVAVGLVLSYAAAAPANLQQIIMNRRDAVVEDASLYAQARKTPTAVVGQVIIALDVGSTGTRYKAVERLADYGGRPDYAVLDEGFITTASGSSDPEFFITGDNIERKLHFFIALDEYLHEQFGPDAVLIARATAGFRQSGVWGQRLADLINQKTSIDFKIISQTQEGELAFVAAAGDPSRDVVVDTGGGSMQLIFEDGSGRLHIVGNESGALRTQQEIFRQLPDLKDRGEYYGLSDEETTAVKQAASESILYSPMNPDGHHARGFEDDLSDLNIARKRIEMNGGEVTAVGAFHRSAILDKVNPGGEAYTRTEVEASLDEMQHMSEQEAQAAFPDDHYYKTAPLSLLIADTLMDALGTQEVYVSNRTNQDGIIVLYLESHPLQGRAQTL